ncbi:MAG: FAD:protein FMN transferase [Myxococcales bacterium]|nr:FAD:protein FMN transferase [Myxococcales bacterium]
MGMGRRVDRLCGLLFSAFGLGLVACGGAGPEASGAAPTRVTPPKRDGADPAKVVEIKEPAPAVDAEAPPVRKDGTIYAESELMGTRFSINLWLDPGRDAADGGAAVREAIAEVDRIEGLASEWIAESELSRFNAAAGGEPIALSPDLFAILQRSTVIAEATSGAFDPTFFAIGDLWSFKPGATPPTQEAIDARLPLVDWRGIELDAAGRGRLRDVGMKVGLGAIAKGYAVDRASALLRGRGFTNHIVEGGGDTFVSGSKGERAWMVGIQRPDGPGTIGALSLENRALVTSGGYQRYFEHDGKRYAHIIDPRTGWPLDEADSAISVSIVADDATDADAYCTAVAVMGPERGMAFVESQPALEAVIIERSGEISLSSGLRERFVPAPPGR